MNQPDLERLLFSKRELRLIKTRRPILFAGLLEAPYSSFRDADKILVQLAVPILIVKYRNGIHSLRYLREDNRSTQCVRINLSPLRAKRQECITREALRILEHPASGPQPGQCLSALWG